MRKLTAWILAILMVFSLATQTFAATVSVEADKQTVSAGEQVVVTVKQDKDLDGVIAIEYRVYYDPDLFELTGSELAANHDLGQTISDSKGTFQVINYLDKTSQGVTIPAGTVATLTFTAKETVTQEQSAGFELVNAGVMDVNGDMIDDNTVENGTVSITVSPAQYKVTLPSDDGYTITVAEGSVSPVNKGGSYSFTVTVDTENYEGTPEVKANGTELTAVDGVYTIENITADQEVTVEGITQKVVEPTTYTVTLPEGAGYTITPMEGSASPVAEGGSYSFTVTVDTENYEGTPVVKANGVNLVSVGGVYTISNINENQTVTVEGIQQQGLAADRVIYQNGSNGAQWPAGVPLYISTVTLKGLCVTDVSWDASYENCTITLHKRTAADAQYSLSVFAVCQVNGPQQGQYVNSFSAAINGTTYKATPNFTYSGSLENGKADIVFAATVQNSSGTKNIHLVVDGTSVEPEPETYEVTLTQGEGYTIAATEGSVSPVTEGGSYSFTVTVDTENYEGTPVVKANGTELTAVDGVYTIENITAAQTVTVEGITKKINTYTVTLTEGAGYTIAASEGSVSPVNEGGSYSFTVTVNDGYEGTPVVKVNNIELPLVDGVYTIENITAAQTVTVEGITKIIPTYTVSLPSGEGYAIEATEGSVSPVQEGGSYAFTVTVSDGYQGTPVVKVNDTELNAVNGVYTIENITANQTVTVAGIAMKSNTYIVEAGADVTASEGESAQVSFYVSGNSNSGIRAYNDYDVTVSYDPTELTYVSAAAAHSAAEIIPDSEAGTIRIVGHGEAKTYSEPVVTLNFTAIESGIHEVSIRSAYIDNSGNAITLDAPKAAVRDQEAAVKVAYPVTLPENFTGENAVLPGDTYSFTAPNDYYEITVTVGGEKVTPDVNGLVYTIQDVNGDVVITATGKSYDVTKIGENVTITGADKAQYGSDYSFTVTADSGYAVTSVTVMVGDAAVDYTISGGQYIISGSEIVDNVTITVQTKEQDADTTQITFEGLDASEVVGGLIQYAPNGQDFTFRLNQEEGYVYTVKLGEAELKAVDGVYTIPAAQINGTPLTVVITKEVYVFAPEVAVSQYIQLDGTVMWLVTATEEDTVLAYGQGNTMFWSEKYNAYCWLVISSETEEAVKATAADTIVAAEETAVATQISYDYDVNQSGAVDVNDAQLTYDMYQAKLYQNFTIVTMDKFLEADVNGDKIVNVEDAAAVVAQILK